MGCDVKTIFNPSTTARRKQQASGARVKTKNMFDLYLKIPPLRCHYIFKSMPIAGFAPLGAAAALMPAIPGCCLWALCARPPDGTGTYRKKSIYKPRPPPAANSRLATLRFRTSLLLITMMSSRIQFGKAVHEAEKNVRSCGLTAQIQFADFFLARTGPWKHQAAALLAGHPLIAVVGTFLAPRRRKKRCIS